MTQQYYQNPMQPMQNQYGPMGYYGQPMPAMAPTYGQVPKMPQFNNPLGQQKINEKLKNGAGLPKITITEDMYDESICTHRNPATGESTLYPIHDGKHKCRICGAEFHIIDGATEDDVVQCAQNLHDLMHTAKCMWVDVPDNVARDYFQVLAIVDQIPQIYSIACDSMNRYNPNANIIQNPMGNVNGFNAVNAMLGGGYGYNPYASTPSYAFQQPQPMAMQPMPQQMPQPGYNVGYDPYQAPMTPMQQQMLSGAPGLQSNGFGVTQAPSPAPQINVSPVQQPAAAQPTAQPAPAPAADAARVTETLSV